MPAFTAPLLEVRRETPRTRVLTIPVDRLFTFDAGQAILLGAHGRERRPYSIASSPELAHETGTIQVLVSVDAAGDPGSHLPQPRPGTLVDLEGPTGAFVIPASVPYAHVLFVAGGTGIAPLRAMADHLLRTSASAQMALLYSARSHDEFAFIDELRAYAAGRRLELHQTVTRDDSVAWIGGRGRIGQSHFEAVLHDPANTLCFVCGPPALVSESVATLRALGVPSELVRIETWERRALTPDPDSRPPLLTPDS